jgi:uncharacterized repeat protein (TIGR01451 family)
MKTASRKIFWAMLLIGAIAVLAPQTALATGTLAGTTVTNNATVSYSVSGQPQPDKLTSTNFKVDDKVSFTLTAQDSGNVTILPGGAAYQTYLLTNTGNGTHDFTFSPLVIGGNTLTPATGPTFYSTNTGIGGTQLPVDGTVTLPYISNLAHDAATTVYMYITAPGAPTDGQFADYTVTAEAYQAGNLGSPSPVKSSAQATIDAGIDKNANLNNQYVVLNDGSGNGGDANRDGKYAVIAKTGGGVTVGFLVSSANIAIGKASVLYSDPLNGVYNAVTNKAPKTIPGAYMIYTLTVTNTGLAPTSALSISDVLPASLGFITYNDGTNTCAANQVVINGACSAAGVTIAGQTLTVTGLSAAAGGGTAIVKYMVVIN